MSTLTRDQIIAAVNNLADLYGVDLSNADLDGADLGNALLSGVNLHSANLHGVNLHSANLAGANLAGANLRYAHLCHADLSGADLAGASLSGANLHGANLRGANLQGANLRGARLRTANLADADLADADLYGAQMRGADLSGATRPEGFDPPCDGCGNLPDDCECIHCERCSQRVESTCSCCDRGADCGCCNCFLCGLCGDPSESGCGECDRCSSCGCECASDDDDGDFERDTNPTRVWPAKRGECARYAGVEYETNDAPNARCYDWARRWGAGWHADGSCGYEAVTPPAAGSNIDRCIGELAEVIGATNSSCGIHVHVDAHDYRWADLYRFLRVFAKVEGLLFVLGGQKRITNTYCEPCGNGYLEALASEDPKNAVLAMAYGIRPIDGHTRDRKGNIVPNLAGKRSQRNYPSKKAAGRYKSLNIAPWIFGRRLPRALRKDTTFEFRLHRNGDGAERVVGWTHLCVALVEWCAKASDADVKRLPRSALRALCTIAPGSKTWILRRVAEWRKATSLDASPQYAIRRVDARSWTIKVDPVFRRRHTPVARNLQAQEARYDLRYVEFGSATITTDDSGTTDQGGA